MSQRKYFYDYPENRELGKWLEAEDLHWIAAQTKKSYKYIYLIFKKGERTNPEAIKYAKFAKKQRIERMKISEL
ncbi:MAG: hypothetical protein K9I29_02665 [Bacteroidales bacterium]|nr:hypothetical protein [Bacteroidales bacterium]